MTYLGAGSFVPASTLGMSLLRLVISMRVYTSGESIYHPPWVRLVR